MQTTHRRLFTDCRSTARFGIVVLSLAATLTGCGGSGGTPVGATPPPGPTADVTPPSVPTGVSATPVSASQVSLTWAAATDDVAVTGYRVYRDGTQVGTIAGTSYNDGGLTPSTTYGYRVAAYDAAGNVSGLSSTSTTTTLSAQANVYNGNPTNYLSLLQNLNPGDTLLLEPGLYDNPSNVPGLPLFDLNGAPGQPITITGPGGGSRPVLVGRSTHNTIRLSNASYIVIRDLEIDGRDLGGDGINAQGTTHHVTIENLIIRGVGSNQQVVGISTNSAPTWNWVIRNNVIIGAGTGMYLGNPSGTNPFVAGLIEHNVIRDTIGYNIEIKHQNVRAAVTGMPTGQNSTVIRHNVFSKSGNSSSGSSARPNLLVGHFPPSGAGASDVYEIYGNFFYQNPSEALFQGEGNVAFHHNLLVNDYGPAIHVQPHNDVPKMIRIFQNTVVGTSNGIRVTGGSASYQQKVIGNAVFAGTPIQATDQVGNITDTYANAGSYLNNPTGALGQLDLFPRTGTLTGGGLDSSSFNTFQDWDRDFNGGSYTAIYRGAYAGEGNNPGWVPRLEIKP